MAALDMEEQQQLLEETTPARRPLGRALAWAAVGLGAAAAVAVHAHASASPVPVATAPKTHDAFAKSLQQLSASFAKIRKMTSKDAEKGADAPDAADAMMEVKALECEGDMLGLEICGEEEADLETKCTEECQNRVLDLLATCGPKLKKAKDLIDLVSACSEHPDGAKEAAKEEEATPEPAAEVDMAKQLECMPLMMQMVTDCHMDQEPNPTAICEDVCHASISSLQKKCQEVLGDDIPLGMMLNMCSGCGGAFMKFGGPDAPGQKACALTEGAFETGDFDACDKACHPFVCGLMTSCPVGVDSGIPGLDEKMISEMHGSVADKTAKCAC